MLDHGMIELTTESVYFAVNKILVLRTKEVVPPTLPCMFILLSSFLVLTKRVVDQHGGETTREKNYRIRACEEPLEEKQNGRLLDCVMIILNNLLKRKIDFAFLFVL